MLAKPTCPVIVDYGSGNLRSVVKAFECVNGGMSHQSLLLLATLYFPVLVLLGHARRAYQLYLA